jgi:hypothetical protein
LLDVIVPAFVSVPPLTFIVMLLFDATVTLAFTFVAALVVVVTAPPLRFSVVAPLPAVFANVNVCPAVGVIVIPPPVVVTVALPLSGAVIASGFAPPPESIATEDAPDTVDPAPNVNAGVPNLIGPPPFTVSPNPPASVTEPLALGAKKLVVPGVTFVCDIVPTAEFNVKLPFD